MWFCSRGLGLVDRAGRFHRFVPRLRGYAQRRNRLVFPFQVETERLQVFICRGILSAAVSPPPLDALYHKRGEHIGRFCSRDLGLIDPASRLHRFAPLT